MKGWEKEKPNDNARVKCRGSRQKAAQFYVVVSNVSQKVWRS